MAVNLDTVVLPLAEDLLGCWCPLLAETTGGAPECGCCLALGPAVADVNHAWVRVVRIYPSRRFPQQSFDLDRCAANEWAAELELGVVRCVAILDDEGRPPSCERVRRDVEVALDDAAAARHAVVCCLAGQRDVVPGAWEPIEPQGGMAGGRMTVTVRISVCCP